MPNALREAHVLPYSSMPSTAGDISAAKNKGGFECHPYSRVSWWFSGRERKVFRHSSRAQPNQGNTKGEFMRTYIISSLLALACVALLGVNIPVRGQTSDVGLTIRVNPTSVSRGTTVGVFAFVTNNTASKLRTTVTFTATAPCGTQTSIGYNKLALDPGQTVQVTVSYPVASNVCVGTQAITISADSSGRNSASSSATCDLMVL